MTMSRPLILVMRHFDAPAERVFDAWLDPVNAGKWLFATPGGKMVRVDIDPKVGGKFNLTDRRDGEDVAHTGTYLEINRPKRLVFTFAVEKYSKEITRVSIDITPHERGCDLKLTHENVPPEWAGRTEEGWAKILDGLARAIDGRR